MGMLDMRSNNGWDEETAMPDFPGVVENRPDNDNVLKSTNKKNSCGVDDIIRSLAAAEAAQAATDERRDKAVIESNAL